MKKRILTALAVAIAIGAQAQDWFLTGKSTEGKDYTLEKLPLKHKKGDNIYSKNRMAKVVVNTSPKSIGEYQLCTILDLSDKFSESQNVDDNYVTISYNIFYREERSYADALYNLKVEGCYDDTKSDVLLDFNNLTGQSMCYYEKNDLLSHVGYIQGHNYYKTIAVKDYKYLVIRFSLLDFGTYYFNNITILGDNNHTLHPGADYKEYFRQSYFKDETYSIVTFDSNGGSQIEDLYYFNSDVTSLCDKNGSPVSTIPVPVRDGYVFKGWQLNGHDYDFNPEGKMFIECYGYAHYNITLVQDLSKVDDYYLRQSLSSYGSYIYDNSPYNYDITLTAKWEAANDVETSINENTMENIYIVNNTLITDTPSNISIFAVNGTLVKTEHNTSMVDISGLKEGLYIAKVNEKTFKFVR